MEGLTGPRGEKTISRGHGVHPPAWRTCWPAPSSRRWLLKAQRQATASLPTPPLNHGTSQASSTGKSWRLEREQRLLGLSGRGEERAEW